MANEIFRSRLINSVRHALNEARAAGALQHPGLVGRCRELLAANILRPVLPLDYSVGSGKIVDSTGQASSELDLVVFHRASIPAVMWSDHDGAFPIESCRYAIEVKSCLTTAAIKDTLRKAKQLSSLKERRRSGGYALIPTQLPFVLFAFDSNIREFEAELQRYLKFDNEGMISPLVNVICIAGHGYFCFDSMSKGWIGSPATAEYDEVLEFVAGTINTLLWGPPPSQDLLLGPYLYDTPGAKASRGDG